MAVALGLGLFTTSTPASAQSVDKLAQKLADMRAEVETLSADLTNIKTDTANELRALARQKSDLQVELEREKVRISKLRSALSKKRDTIEERSANTEDLAPIFDAALASLESHVNASLPFKRSERLAELDKIAEQRSTGVMTYERALSRLWSFVEDEFRLTRESGVFRQTIALDETELLTDVIRVGMVMLLFKTAEGRIGKTVKGDSGWRFVEIDGSEARRQVRELFDSFRKQIRIGFFNIPNALPPIGGER